MKFKIKQKIFEIKKLTYKNIDKKYIVSLNNRNIKYKKNVNKEAIFFRPNPKSYKLVYICVSCSQKWSP